MKFLAGLLIVFLIACTPKAAVPAPEPLKAPAAQPAAAPPVAAPASPPQKVAEPAQVFDESLLTGHEFLLEVFPANPVLRDIRLGPLASGPMVSVVETMFQSVAKDGDTPLDPQTLVPRWALYLQGWARRAHKEGLAGTVRAGQPLPEDNGTMIPVRVIGEKKEWSGWVFLVKDKANWLVADVQLESSDRGTEPFDPEGRNQPISSPSLR